MKLKLFSFCYFTTKSFVQDLTALNVLLIITNFTLWNDIHNTIQIWSIWNLVFTRFIFQRVIFQIPNVFQLGRSYNLGIYNTATIRIPNTWPVIQTVTVSKIELKSCSAVRYLGRVGALIFNPIFILTQMIGCCVFWPAFGCCAPPKSWSNYFLFSTVFNLFCSF